MPRKKKKQETVAEERDEMIVSVILDESGSMASVSAAALSAVNEYIMSLKKDYEAHPEFGKIFLNFVTFNHSVTSHYTMRDISEVSEIEHYNPSGSTALFDAIGETIKYVKTLIPGGTEIKDSKVNALADFLAGEKSSKKKILFIIQTDGEENASQTYRTKKAIQEIIKEMTDAGHDFVYLGAGIDKFSAHGGVGSLGLSASGSLSMPTSSGSYTVTYGALSEESRSYRRGLTKSVSTNVVSRLENAFSEEDTSSIKDLLDKSNIKELAKKK